MRRGSRHGRHPPAARLDERYKALVNLGGFGLWASGAAWLGLRYFMVRQGQFGPERSPAEPWALKVHGGFAFLVLWTFGLLWGVHVVNAWGQKRRRWTGSALFAAFLLMILTGYLLYYLGDEGGRAVVSAIHWVIGLAAPAVYLVHRLVRAKSGR